MSDPAPDPVLAGLEARKARSLCGSCKKDYDVMIDALKHDDELEAMVREMVAAEKRHPDAALLPERAAQIAAARDEAARRLGRPPTSAPAPAPSPARPDGRLLRFHPGELRETARAWRTDIGRVIPRPLGLLSNERRRRT